MRNEELEAKLGTDFAMDHAKANVRKASKAGQYVAVSLFATFLICLGVLIAMAFQIGPAVLEAVCR